MKSKLQFIDANQEPVEYDDSPITFRVSAYAVIVKEDKLLVIKNKKEKLHDIPGGGIEIHETLEEALKRECIEEAGAKIQIGTIISHYEDFFYHREERAYYHAFQMFFQATILGELQKPTDPNIEYVEFIPISDLDQHPLPPGALKAVKTVL